MTSDLAHAAAAAQRVAALAEIIVVPAGERRRAPNTVQVIQTTVSRKLSERGKTTGEGGGGWREENTPGEAGRERERKKECRVRQSQS